MRVLLVVTVLALVALATAEPGVLDAIKKTAQDAKTLVKGSRSTPPKVLSSKRSSNSSSSSSSAAKVDPKLMAKEIIAVFGDADGSAYFKGNKILPHTVAEVPPRKKAHRAHSSHHARSRSRSSSSSEKHRFREPIASPVKKTAIPPPPPAPPAKRPVSTRHSSSSSSRSSAENPRYRRPLFNFNSVPAGVTGVGLRKHHFGKKHHTLLVRFANAHSKVTTVIVVDKFVGPAGRPSKKRGDDRRRGKKQSDLEIKNLKHPNLFVFNEHGEQVFPKKKGSQSSKSKHSSARKQLKKETKTKQKETLMDKMKKKLSPKKH